MSENEAPQETQEFTPIQSQEELNQIVESRIARERKKFSDYDDLKAKAAKADELEAQALIEQERAVKDAVSNREAELNSYWAEKFAFKSAESEAAKMGFIDPSDVSRYLDVSEVMSDGDIDSKALGKQLEQILTDRPYLAKAQEQAPNPAQGRRIKRSGAVEKSGAPKGSRAASMMRDFSRVS